MATPREQGKPVGRDQVVAAVLEHAADLFAERGPAATSTRDIAARATVNPALVFRHFGTKDLLVGAVLDYLAARSAAARKADADPSLAEAETRRQWRVITRALMDGYPVGRLQHQFPGVAELIEKAGARYDDEAEARLAAANVVALRLGWQLAEPSVRAAAGLDAVSEERIQDGIRTATENILGNGDRASDR
ncbi:TetR/AcrR family transcriptional regulator [Nocardia sp. CA2R105]|uniref:TetR/AcrR family transcriptional regulator n=1 Tax=Nocardia coffeae TaxID=2873381 RepID=UPI001CA62DA1|nr:TetR/AcrR family transcriptional regulator [Nocardia coffeae]MBY8860771.1 TetR/AcrR family transcriptional regulator [Nocardia coffeae]